MLVFDEEKYAKNILSRGIYKSKSNQGRERCIVTRYLSNIGFNNEQIKKELMKISKDDFYGLNNEQINKIFDKIILKSNEYPFIHNVEVNIYETELEFILGLKNKTERDLLFILLVYYKWALNNFNLYFYSKKNNINLVKENDKELLKLIDTNKMSLNNKKMIFNSLYKSNYYKIENFKDNNYFYIPFYKDIGDIKIKINNYDNLILYLYNYINPDNFKKCEECGCLIKKTTSNNKYCKDCAEYIVKNQKRQWKKNNQKK